MQSGFIDLDNPWIVGVVTGIIVIIAQLLFISTIEHRRWLNARYEFPSRSLEFAEYLTKSIKHSMTRSSGMVFLDDDLKKALQDIQDESDNFTIFLNIYSQTIPSYWAADVSSIADKIMLASRSARTAALCCPDLSRREVKHSLLTEMANFIVTDIGQINEDRRVFTGTAEEVSWKKFGQEVYLCCCYLSSAVDDLLRFHHKNAKHSLSSNSQAGDKNGGSSILVGEVAKNGRHIKACADLMEQWKLNRLRLQVSSRVA